MTDDFEYVQRMSSAAVRIERAMVRFRAAERRGQVFEFEVEEVEDATTSLLDLVDGWRTRDVEPVEMVVMVLEDRWQQLSLVDDVQVGEYL